MAMTNFESAYNEALAHNLAIPGMEERISELRQDDCVRDITEDTMAAMAELFPVGGVHVEMEQNVVSSDMVGFMYGTSCFTGLPMYLFPISETEAI